jgi:hypothetical protein
VETIRSSYFWGGIIFWGLFPIKKILQHIKMKSNLKLQSKNYTAVKNFMHKTLKNMCVGIFS